MVHLATMRGRATITANGNDLGKVGYSISVFRPALVIEAHGYIMGPAKVLDAAMQAGDAVLILRGGEKINIDVTQSTEADERADITVSGPVPGF